MFTTRNLLRLFLVCGFGPLAFFCDKGEVQQIIQITSGRLGEGGPQCSPDGHYLAFEYFSPEHPNAVQLWLMPTTGKFSDAKSLLGYTGKSYGEISWSQDSAWLSFIGGSPESSGVISSQVFKINVASGEIAPLANLPAGTSLGAGTSWSKHEQIAFEMDDDIYVVSKSGGSVAKLIDVKDKLPGVSPFYPSWSPDGARVAFVGRTDQERGLYVADLESRRIEKVLSNVADDGPSWFDDSRILASHVEGQANSAIWMVNIRDKSHVSLTHGFYDISPAGCADGKYIYFSRNADISQTNGPLMRGFHIWRASMRAFSP
jgi:Tol biopolymer transport system component